MRVGDDESTETALPEVSSATVTIRTALPEIEDDCVSVLILSFAGVYPPGSAGSSTAEWMQSVLGSSLALHEPDVVVLDLLELEYTWGNSMLGIFSTLGHWQAPEPPRVVVVGGEKSIDAMSSLLTPRDAAAPDFLFRHLEPALDYAVRVGYERTQAYVAHEKAILAQREDDQFAPWQRTPRRTRR